MFIFFIYFHLLKYSNDGKMFFMVFVLLLFFYFFLTNYLIVLDFLFLFMYYIIVLFPVASRQACVEIKIIKIGVEKNG